MKWLTQDKAGEELAVPTGYARWLRPTPPIPRPGLREFLFDALLAFLLIAPGKAVIRYSQIIPGDSHIELDKGTALAAGVSIIIPVLIRRRLPLTALWILLAALLRLPAPLLNVAAAVVICAYSAAVYSPYRRLALASPVVAYALLWMHGYLNLIPGGNNIDAALIGLPLLMGAAAYGTQTRRRAYADLGEQRRQRAERQQEEIRRAVEDERSRIARELHDVVTHNVSVMVVMAGAARKVLERSPAQATAALLEVEAAGRAAMGELRQVMGLLTESVREQHQLAPQPGVDQLGVLVGRIRATGVPIDYRVVGEPRVLSPGIDLTAYRVVQEALTNTVKHASGASVTILVEYKPAQLILDIADTGGAPGHTAEAGNGRGLIGLRERVAVHGGTAEAGPLVGGGYRVRVQIPLPVEDAA